MSNFDTYPCSCCGKEKRIKDFYKSYSPLHKYHEILPMCKECVLDNVDISSPRSVMNMLRMIDRPFIDDLWESSIKESEKDDAHVFGVYMKNLAMRQYRHLTWEDSNTEGRYIEHIDNDMTFDKEVRDRWRGWSDEDIKILESKYQDLIASYEDRTPIQRNIYRNIAIAQMQADKAIAEGKIGDFKQLMNVVSTLMTDGRLKPVQETGDESGGLNTWGEWVKKIEEDEPLPEPSEEFKDVDNIKKYFDEWFVGHMKKVFGIGGAYTDTTKDDKS